MLEYLNPLNWLRWLAQFVSAWLQSTPWRDAPKAIPALILLLALTVTGSIALTEGSGLRSRQIDRQLAHALEIDDYETAELVLRRQIQAKPDDFDLRYRLAVARREQGAEDEAVALMRELVRGRNHEQAARWLLQERFIGRQWADLTQDDRTEYGDLLERIHGASPEEAGIQRLLAGYYIDTGRPGQAVPLLVDLSRQTPTLGLQAAAIQRRLGNQESADRLAEQTLAALQERLREEPTNSKLSLVVAENQIFLERFSDAINTLGNAVKRGRTDEQRGRLRQALANAIVVFARHLEQSPERTQEQQVQILRMLEKALEIAPNNPRVLTLIVDQMLTAGEGQHERIDQLRESLVEGASPGISHFIRGTSALINDDADKAMMHLEIAAELLPNHGAILNNLAVAMTSREDVDLEKALRISEKAIQQTANATPHFYETRGQILFRLERYLKAVPDLERALAVPALASQAHTTLAACYQELGDQELSEQHQRAAEATASAEAKVAAGESP